MEQLVLKQTQHVNGEFVFTIMTVVSSLCWFHPGTTFGGQAADIFLNPRIEDQLGNKKILTRACKVTPTLSLYCMSHFLYIAPQFPLSVSSHQTSLIPVHLVTLP